MIPISVAPASMSAWGSSNTAPVPPASSGKALGSVQSFGVTRDATRGMPASAIAAATSAWPWVPSSLIVAITPAPAISRTHASD